MNPTVSVVMPTRGRPVFVDRALRSVLEQSFQNFEIIILDNSPAPERERIRKFAEIDSRIRFIERGNTSVTEARRSGAMLSSGKLFSLLDSDDYWAKERLTKHVEVWERNYIGLSWDRWSEVRGNAVKPHPQPFPGGLIQRPKVATKLYEGNFIHASAGIVSSDFARQLGFPRPDIMSSDWILFMRAAEYYPSCFLDETLSFNELGSPNRVTDTVSRDFLRKELLTVRRWALLSRPSIYGTQYIQTKTQWVLRKIRTPQVLHEPPVMNVLSKINGNIFIDVGANRGQFSIPLSRNFKKVIAIEPNPSLTIYGKNILVLRCAISDTIGETNLYLDTHPINGRWTLDTIIDDFAYRPGYDPNINEEIRGTRALKVATNTLDNIMSEFDQVDLVKVDVEGAEFLVLRGASKSLQEHKIVNIVVELHDREKKGELERLLFRYGYDVKWLDRDHVLASLGKSRGVNVSPDS